MNRDDKTNFGTYTWLQNNTQVKLTFYKRMSGDSLTLYNFVFIFKGF